MKYIFNFCTATDGYFDYTTSARNLNQGLDNLAEYVLRHYPDISFLSSCYSVCSESEKWSERKLKKSNKNYFWTFLAAQKEMEASLEKNKVL